jgi:hypothetical protein
MFYEVGGGVDHARDQDHLKRERVLSQRFVFVLVPRIGKFDAQRTNFGSIE